MQATDEITKLRTAMAALEAQRPLLGDAVVEATLTALREKLAALEGQTASEQQRKLATVLFMDIAGHTALIRDLDPEENMALIDAALARLAEPVGRYGGHVARYQGDGFKAVFGLPTAHEDDPENAVRAALDIQAIALAVAEAWTTERGIEGFRVRVGIDTGLVFAGGLTEGEDTVKGMPVNLAARLESAAEPGTILISHNTYRHVRGVFDVQAREPITVKGVEGSVQTYVVQRAKPRAFRMATRGVEGVETRMVGREVELLTLQQAYTDALQSSETRAVAIIGEAGVGKSRLLYEFNNWLELRPETIRYFKGRSTPNLQNVPYSLFRDLFTFRFQIYESDSTAVALEKFRAGMAGVLAAEQADVVGHWLGFDFSASETVAALLGGADFGAMARAHLTRYLRMLAAAGPVVIFLEDAHWADDSSLDLAAQLPAAIPQAKMLVVAVTRPSLFERRPGWGGEEVAFRRVKLTPLSKQASRALVDEILQRVDEVPDSLRELIVDAAEGNPFYVEELVKMLIDQGVIVGADLKPAPTGVAWRVRMDRLQGLKAPPTLTGLLQARLDGLPRPEREALQRASVVGRLFWDDAVATLLQARPAAVIPTLEAICRRELIFLRERSTFQGTEEYIFKHALLRDVTYETVLLKHRQELHRHVARWLEGHAGERIGEYLGLIAEHFIQGGEPTRAANYLRRAGDEAIATGAFQAARPMLERALALSEAAGETDSPTAIKAAIGLGKACRQLGDFAAAEAALARGLAGARQLGDGSGEAEALATLAEIARASGDYTRARALSDLALPLGRTADNQTLMLTLLNAAAINWSAGALDAAETYATDALEAARQAGDLGRESSALNLLGLSALSRRDPARAAQLFEASLPLARRAHHLSFEARAFVNLGEAASMSGDNVTAQRYGRAAMERYRELGMKHSLAIALGNVAEVNLALGNVAAAREHVHELLKLATALGHTSRVLTGLSLVGLILATEGRFDRALTLYGLIRVHSSLEHQTRLHIEESLTKLELPAAEVEAGLAAGAALDFETVVQEILDGKW